MQIHISDKKRENTTINKIRTSLAEIDLRTVESIEFVVDDLNSTVTLERLEKVYRILESLVADICVSSYMFNDNEAYTEIHIPRVVIKIN